MQVAGKTFGAVILWTTTFLTAAVWAAAPIRLSGPSGHNSSVTSIIFSPDGNQVLFRGDQDAAGVWEIFAVPLTGGTPLQLNGSLVSGGDVGTGGLQFSPDGSRVMYVADQDVDEIYEVYSVPSTGGTAVKLNEPFDPTINSFNAFKDVTSTGLQFSPDSSFVIYSANQDYIEAYDLYSVPSVGGPINKLTPQLGPKESAYFASISPDSSHVVYWSDHDVHGVYDLYSIPSTGGARVKLNDPLPTWADVRNDFRLTPDGSHVVYYSNQNQVYAYELFSVPSTGGTPVRLNSDLAENGGYATDGLKFSAQGDRVFFGANLENEGKGVFSVPVTGGPPQKLTSPNGINDSIYYWDLSPDRSQLIFAADPDHNSKVDLFAVPATGGTPLPLVDSLASPGSFVQGPQPTISPTGELVLYHVYNAENKIFDIYTVSTAGGSPVRLTPDDFAGRQIANRQAQFSPDGRRVIYQGDQEALDVEELFIVPSTGGTPVRVNAPLIANGDVVSWEIRYSPDGSRVLYTADQAVDGRTELYARIVEADWVGGSGTWDEAANWSHGYVPDEVMQTAIAGEAQVTVGGQNVHQAFSLDVGDGSGTSVLDLHGGTQLTVINGVTIGAGGVLSGNGAIAGDVTVLTGGEIAPGGDAGVLALSSLTLAAGSTLSVEILGTSGDSAYDRVEVTGHAALGGRLAIDLSDDVVLQVGDEFQILDSNSSSGQFDLISLPDILGDDLMWNTSRLYESGVVGVTIAGDFNGDEAVDTSDYTVWRNGLGTDYLPSDYAVWKSHFGQRHTPGAGSVQATANVPEPNTFALLLVLAGLGYLSKARISRR